MDRSLKPDGGIRKQDALVAIWSVARNRIGRDMTWDWLRNNWDKISKYFDTTVSSTVGDIVQGIASDFSSESKLKELIDFYDRHEGDLDTIAELTKQAGVSKELLTRNASDSAREFANTCSQAGIPRMETRCTNRIRAPPCAGTSRGRAAT